MGPAGMEEMTEQLRGMFSQMGQGAQDAQAAHEGEAMKLLVEEEAASSSTRTTSARRRCTNAEQNGIVFIDEIDKVASRAEHGRAPRSRARACSATCCRWWKAPPSPPSTAWSHRPHPVHRLRRLPPQPSPAT
jgi:hypothetical protein